MKRVFIGRNRQYADSPSSSSSSFGARPAAQAALLGLAHSAPADFGRELLLTSSALAARSRKA